MRAILNSLEILGEVLNELGFERVEFRVSVYAPNTETVVIWLTPELFSKLHESLKNKYKVNPENPSDGEAK